MKSLTRRNTEGRLAQLVERLPYKERVRSSSLLTPTIKKEVIKTSFFMVSFDSENLPDTKYHKEVRASRAEA